MGACSGQYDTTFPSSEVTHTMQRSLTPLLSPPLPQVSLEVVELDSKMVEVSERWFGFPGAKGAERLAVHVGEGAEFIRQQCAAGKKGMSNS